MMIHDTWWYMPVNWWKIPIWQSNMAMENPPFMDDFPVLSFHDLSTSMRRMYDRALTSFKLGIERLFPGLGVYFRCQSTCTPDEMVCMWSIGLSMMGGLIVLSMRFMIWFVVRLKDRPFPSCVLPLRCFFVSIGGRVPYTPTMPTRAASWEYGWLSYTETFKTHSNLWFPS